ncbi:uncharacterized protein TNIN_148291 [Trichonephila inaurata madagascariensis]|uniref:Apolipoprotein L3 n=1 Tax=Trichonephila inaurata madagascariensis TaxID=2747483 RepID=A0A8X7C1T8_9ARAC|nr:uncharacterized protein TNIN_349851 [Trichonephila inaurata madagascariensis]GFY53671.1 uncharacterized protein TNIN_148291 [Trichonephila inaurata madagascariensis]
MLAIAIENFDSSLLRKECTKRVNDKLRNRNGSRQKQTENERRVESTNPRIQHPEEVLTTLHKVAEKIDKHHHNVNLATLTGISSSIAGGAAGIGGLILAPMSGGLSLALSAGGLVGTVAGSATTLGASIAEVYLTKDLTEKASKVLETDAFYTNALSAAFKEVLLHEQEVIGILSELKNDTLLEDLEKVLRSSSCCDEMKKRFAHMKDGANSLEDILILVKSLYPEDHEFLRQLKKTDDLFGEAPSLSSTLSSSSGFFQGLKELAVVGPDTLKSISGAALQSTAANSAQIASCATQVITASLGAVFVALDIYQFMKTSKNYDEGSKTELANKMRSVAEDLEKEKQQIMKLNEFYRQQIHVDIFNDTQ